MRPMQIPKRVVTEIVLPAIPSDTVRKAWDGDDNAWAEMETIETHRETLSASIWHGIQSGKFRVAWYDGYRNGNRWMRYIVHRSTYVDGAIQISCMEMIEGTVYVNGNNMQIIPTSHHASETVDDFVKEIAEGASARVICVEWN